MSEINPAPVDAERHGTVIPDGWQLVPKEPTDKMMIMGGFSFAGTMPNDEVFPAVRNIWAKMISKAPFPPTATQEPVFYVSEQQLGSVGDYLPTRAEPEGNFQLALYRAPPAAAQAPMAVKALEWKAPEKVTNWCWTAKSPFGVYSVVNEDGWYAAREPEGFWEWNGDQITDTRDSAFRACEADYEQRIRSALSNSQSPLCSDCPRIGHSTDETRCLPCPGRVPQHVNGGAYRKISAEEWKLLGGDDNKLCDWHEGIGYVVYDDLALEQFRAKLASISQSDPAPEMAEDAHACPVCLVPFVASDICATDIELGTCHAACLEGSPTVNLDTGEPIDGPIPTFPYSEDLEAEMAALRAENERLRRMMKAMRPDLFADAAVTPEQEGVK